MPTKVGTLNEEFVKETAIEKRSPSHVREKGQYALVFSVIALMLYAVGFPIFLLFFVGVLTLFIWKVFSAESRNETRRVFEFYLSANEILREDDRRWYGFEIHETIQRGEQILRSINAAPPLVHFALGALYQKLDDHSSAEKHLSRVVEESSAETAIVFPTRELREYVRMLRKIERAPAEAPVTAAAVRSLERARKNKAKTLLENSRSQLAIDVEQLPAAEKKAESVVDMSNYRGSDDERSSVTDNVDIDADAPLEKPLRFVSSVVQRSERSASAKADRKSISEVLHDIYDQNN
jgi:hypothetical protein